MTTVVVGFVVVEVGGFVVVVGCGVVVGPGNHFKLILREFVRT